MTFSARFIANIIHFATQQGASKKALLDLVDYDFDELLNEQLRVEASVYNRVLEHAIQLTGDNCFGLHLGEYLSLSAAGIVAQISQASATIQEALEHLVAFANLGCQALPFSLEPHGTQWEVSVRPSPLWIQQSPLSVQHTIDSVFVFTLREFHTLTHQKHFPESIHFQRPRPANVREYERVFQCPIHFQQAQNALYLNGRQVAAKIITSDYQLLRILVQHANDKLHVLANQQGLVNTVQQSIIHLVNPQFPSIQQVARTLNMSVRTLQRRLKTEGHTYKSVLDTLKRQFALDYLQKKHLTIQQIADLLDYSEASAFNRSFKRWTGMNPQKYRTQNRVVSPREGRISASPLIQSDHDHHGIMAS
ncbi:MAG: AraC family transcriptional regulator, partial [Bacteroidota bacterium]